MALKRITTTEGEVYFVDSTTGERVNVDPKYSNPNSDIVKKEHEPLQTRKGKNELENIQIMGEKIKNYKVVPFNQSDNVPSSLQRIIDSEAVNGWEYVNHQYSDKLKPGSAGCFGIGATPDSTVHIGFIIFEKKIV